MVPGAYRCGALNEEWRAAAEGALLDQVLPVEHAVSRTCISSMWCGGARGEGLSGAALRVRQAQCGCPTIADGHSCCNCCGCCNVVGACAHAAPGWRDEGLPTAWRLSTDAPAAAPMPPTDSLRSGVAAPPALGPAPNTDSRGLTMPSSEMAPPPPPMPSTLGRTIAAAAPAELAAAGKEVPRGEAFCLSCGSFVSDDACAQGRAKSGAGRADGELGGAWDRACLHLR